MMDADQRPGDAGSKGLEEGEESTESLVCSVLSALQKLGEQLQTSNKVCLLCFDLIDSFPVSFLFLLSQNDPVPVSKTLPGSVLDETPELIVSQEVLVKLLARDDLLSPQQHLQMFDSPLNISMDFGKRHHPEDLGFMVNKLRQKALNIHIRYKLLISVVYSDL